MKEASHANFTNFLPAFKQVFNNSINAFTGQISNKIIYEFNLSNLFNIVTDNKAKKFEAEHKIYQQETQDLIAWANLVMKKYYNRHYILLLLNSEDFVILK